MQKNKTAYSLHESKKENKTKKTRNKTKKNPIQNINRALGIWKKTLKKCQPEAENVMKIPNEVCLVFQVPQDPKSLEFSGPHWGGVVLLHIHAWKSANMPHFSVVHNRPSRLSCPRSSLRAAFPGGRSPCDQNSKAAVGDLWLPLHLCKTFSNRKMLFGVNKEVVWGLKLFLL